MKRSHDYKAEGVISPCELGERIRANRELRGHGNRVLFCKGSHVNPGTLASYERGSASPSYASLIQLSDMLEVTVGQILGLESVPGLDDANLSSVQMRRERLNSCYVSSPDNARILDTVVECLGDQGDDSKAMDAMAAIMDVSRPCLTDRLSGARP